MELQIRSESVRSFTLALTVFVMAAGVAFADQIDTTLNKNETPEGGWSVNFSTGGSCEEECAVADLSCESSRSAFFMLNDLPGTEAAALMTSDDGKTSLKVAGRRFALSLQQFSFVELTGAWNVTARLEDDQLAFYKAIGTAKTFDAVLNKRKLTLPVNQDVRNWAKSCAE